MCSIRVAVWFFVFLGLVPFIPACGDLEEDGQSNTELIPANVQDILTDRCAVSGCHVGGHSTGMDLREANAYLTTVNVPSSEKPSVDRVEPGQSASSYLYQKITGAPDIEGDQMPLIGGPLSTQQIELIGAWIDQGALPRQQQPNVFVLQTYSFTMHVAPIFQSHCGGCHDGSGASLPASMNLLSNTYAAVVNVVSEEVPSYKRVKPFFPDSSYLYHKIVPSSSVRSGERMPAGGPYLGSATIDTIHTWITEGAIHN